MPYSDTVSDVAVSGNNKLLPRELVTGPVRESSCSTDLMARSKLLQAELQNFFCQQMSRGGSEPLLTFKPRYV